MIHMVRVVAVHPESHAVDVVFVEDARRIAGVQVMSPMAGGDVGISDLPQPDVTTDNPYETGNSETRDIYAGLMFLNGIPVVIGFLFPQIAQCLFEDINRRINRHASDVYTNIDKHGNTEVYHPSGTYLRIGTAPAHEDLTGKDYDKRWKIEKNTNKAVHVHLTVANAGAVKATINIDPAGNVAVMNVGNTQIETTGTMRITSGGTMDLIAGGNMSLQAPRIDWN